MFSMTQLIRRAAQTRGNDIATVDGDRTQTWNEFVEKVARFAGGLQRIGVGTDSCVAIMALNSDRYFEFMFAVPWAGGVFQPIITLAPGILDRLSIDDISIGNKAIWELTIIDKDQFLDKFQLFPDICNQRSKTGINKQYTGF